MVPQLVWKREVGMAGRADVRQGVGVRQRLTGCGTRTASVKSIARACLAHQAASVVSIVFLDQAWAQGGPRSRTLPRCLKLHCPARC